MTHPIPLIDTRKKTLEPKEEWTAEDSGFAVALVTLVAVLAACGTALGFAIWALLRVAERYDAPSIGGAF